MGPPHEYELFCRPLTPGPSTLMHVALTPTSVDSSGPDHGHRRPAIGLEWADLESFTAHHDIDQSDVGLLNSNGQPHAMLCGAARYRGRLLLVIPI